MEAGDVHEEEESWQQREDDGEASTSNSSYARAEVPFAVENKQDEQASSSSAAENENKREEQASSSVAENENKEDGQASSSSAAEPPPFLSEVEEAVSPRQSLRKSVKFGGREQEREVPSFITARPSLKKKGSSLSQASSKKLQFHTDESQQQQQEQQGQQGQQSTDAGNLEEGFEQDEQLKDEDQENYEDYDAEEEEEYDPYHGIGASKDPIMQFPVEMVFTLMNADRFRDVSEQSCPGRTKLCRNSGILFGISAAASLAFCFALLGTHLHHSPQLPRLEIDGMNLALGEIYPVNASVIEAQQREGKGNYFAYRLNFVIICVLNLSNPNTNVDFHYDYLELSLVYRGTTLGYDRVEAIGLPRESTRQPVLMVVVLGLPLPLKVGYTFKPEITIPDFRVVAEFSARIRMSVLAGIKDMVFQTRYRCELHQTPDDLIQKCGYLNGDKGTPSHKHLRFWRTPDWPYDLPSFGNVGIPVPPEYYDPEINYGMRGP